MILSELGSVPRADRRLFEIAGRLWEGHRIQDVATPEAFERNPEMVLQFYNMRRDDLQSAKLATTQLLDNSTLSTRVF